MFKKIILVIFSFLIFSFYISTSVYADIELEPDDKNIYIETNEDNFN